MKINSSEFIISAVSPKQYPTDGLPEIALAGRSNVGKSSLINTLLNRKNLARTSQRPGKTQTLNYYKINDAFYFVDVPGYGYAKVSKKEKEAWGTMLDTYFQANQPLKAIVQLVDLRHPPSKEDIYMHDYLIHYGHPTITVATKADKISKNKQEKYKRVIAKDLRLTSDDPFILFSSFNGQGKDTLWKTIQYYMKNV
ncbi:YihA family ribosome biogenesis GTP-binding protein [Terrilactibacillus sp. BCM23-1]|uniref:Probable GTP-binding protein EngB n=1 Tax=Terrilactibacillus tamarindi TaxID=2599694 RepID=A0A6N8CPZ4_9BACI|nr:ribosome biogenesis GTP-binding protein YihA/YsxC [Terrilactibacillus tamarindi]MTT31728.1 YihA family ribosome biogenesis GTP-binding protein [Terrilactibacillus tamarindi]